jgi:hypothetical protein
VRVGVGDSGVLGVDGVEVVVEEVLLVFVKEGSVTMRRRVGWRVEVGRDMVVVWMWI